MSNNKQSSVKWLQWALEYTVLTHEQMMQTIELFEQAKAMHKEEIRVAYMEGAFQKMRHLDGKEFMMPTDYYNETFGGNNEQS